jgi:cation transport regulator ChaC
MTLYFAYGSNMDRSAMKRRCPGAHAVGPAVLEGYRFFVGIDGWGSVGASLGDTIHGVLWRLTPRDIAALHAYELLHQGLYDVRHLPVRHESRLLRAMIYLLRRRAVGTAKPGNAELVAMAAREWNLLEPYVRSVERWSVSRYTGARAINRESARE